MYAAVAQEGRLHSDPKAGSRVVNGWLEHGADQLWIDLESPSHEDLAYLRDRFGLHPLAVEECDHTGVRPKIEEFETHLFLVLHGINHNPDSDRLRTVEFKVFLRAGLLITIHDRPSTSIRAAQERLQKDPQLLSRAGVDSVLHHIVDAVVDHYFPVLEDLENEVDRVEGEVLRSAADGLLEDILRLQRQVLTLNRLVHPQLDIMGALASGRYTEIDAADLAYFRDVYDHLQRMSERLHVAREMLLAAMQCYLSQVSNRTNAVMKSLGVVATVVLPATVIASLFGIEVSLPGTDQWGTLWIVAALSALTSAALLAILKAMKWL